MRACFINSQSFTACQKQTKQVIKISVHHASEKDVKQEDMAMLSASSRSHPTGKEIERN